MRKITDEHDLIKGSFLFIHNPLAQQSCGGDIGSVPYVYMCVRTYVCSNVHLLSSL